MDENLIPTIVLVVFAVSVCWFSEQAKRKAIVSCRCGKHQSQNITVMDDADEKRISDTLSELCVFCRNNGGLSHA